MVARPPRRLRRDAFEAQALQVQLVDKDVDHPDRVLLGYVILKIFREQRALTPVRTLDEALHRDPRSHCSGI
jgi:hypothetical protein